MTATAQTIAPGRDPVFRGNQARLSAAQLCSGIGIATGFAVGGILAEELTGRAQYAGFAQTASILGAALLAIPLARLAREVSRRVALSVGFGIAVLGAALVLLGAATGLVVPFFLGMLAFGAATATGLQSRYAATDAAAPSERARAMSVVVWASTVGSVAGPNLAGIGGKLGHLLGIGVYGGPFLISTLAFLGAVACVAGLRAPSHDITGAPRPTRGRPADGLRAVVAHPGALLGLATVVLGQTIMVSVMVMTPVHLHGHGTGIQLIGIVISLHILGMYGLSPVMGILADRVGPRRVIWLGFALFAIALGVGLVDGLGTSNDARVMVALVLLGLGWSACFIAGSTLLSSSVPEAQRVPVQGLSDACMNVGAAVFAAVAGPLLAVGGFALINTVAFGILGLGILVAIVTARRARQLPDLRLT